MARMEEGWPERVRHAPAEYLVLLARARGWQGEGRFVKTVANVDEAAPFLVVPLQEVLVRAAWAAVRSWEPQRVLDFLLEVDELIFAPPG